MNIRMAESSLEPVKVEGERLGLISNQKQKIENGRSAKRERSTVTSNGMTYADWLTRAIESDNARRLTLSEIYDWFVSNVPGLSEQRHLHSSKGWKNAVRHTLSVNARFCKLARPGRPSFWTLAAPTATAFPSTSTTINTDKKYNRKSEKKRLRTVSSPAPTIVIDDTADHKRPRTISASTYSDFNGQSIVSTTAVTPPACTSQATSNVDAMSWNSKIEPSSANYMIDLYQIPLALAAVAVSASRVFRPKPTTNFTVSPTSAFVKFRPQEKAVG